tara:strand:+ start:5839 stop:6054 length:216 start_codon:yes stop_codon:yes gene_type:complete
MNELYLEEKECYRDTMLCLETNISTLSDVYFVLQYYEHEEHYECCSGIIRAINDYKKTITIGGVHSRHTIL